MIEFEYNCWCSHTSINMLFVLFKWNIQSMELWNKCCEKKNHVFTFRIMTPLYQQFLALQFAIKEINEDVHILQNHTLGFHIYNSYFTTTWTYRASLEVFSSKDRFIPNYSCDQQNRPIAVIGGPTSAVQAHMSTILSLYKIPQVQFLLGILGGEEYIAFFPSIFLWYRIIWYRAEVIWSSA